MATTCHSGRARGFTQASMVTPDVMSSEGASFTVIQLLVPSNKRAPPNLPAAIQVAPEMKPVLPLPEKSVTVAPEPSLKLYAATSPVGGGDVLTVTAALAVKPPDEAVMVAEPLATAVTNPAPLTVATAVLF